jgi:hypothetical protein
MDSKRKISIEKLIFRLLARAIGKHDDKTLYLKREQKISDSELSVKY